MWLRSQYPYGQVRGGDRAIAQKPGSLGYSGKQQKQERSFLKKWKARTSSQIALGPPHICCGTRATHKTQLKKYKNRKKESGVWLSRSRLQLSALGCGEAGKTREG